ncbi:MAG: UDP-3-O-(3-hydroxymyristoyl)glucosamine N-acyltransferase [Candidatus Korobacteraceae bacterium]|jgi:UDP-3-O-[3-hydroxymyristoyl] glucosamine N-acyltransferase
MKLLEIARRIGASAENVPAELEITGVAGLDEAGTTELSFLSNPRYTPQAATTRAAAIIVTTEFPANGRPLLRSPNPQLAYAKALELFYTPPRYPAGIHPTAVIAASARIGANPSIGAYAVIGEEVEIGANCTILPHVVIYGGARIGDNFFAHAHAVVREFCRLGDNVILQNGVIVGADGYGFARDGESWHKIVQSGTAVLGNDVEVQANACVDRATLGETRIGDGTKIDNLAQVGHGSKVGKNTMLCGQVGLAGSTRVGDNAILAGQVGIAGHCTIGDNAVITAQSGVSNDVPANAMISGSPAFDHRQWMRAVAVFAKLPELAKAIRKFTRG